MHLCLLNLPQRNDWSKITFRQVHGSSVLKTLSFKSLNWISAAIFAELIQVGQGSKHRKSRTFWRKNMVFHGRKISYFILTYIYIYTYKHTHICVCVCVCVCVCIYIYILIIILELSLVLNARCPLASEQRTEQYNPKRGPMNDYKCFLYQ